AKQTANTGTNSHENAPPRKRWFAVQWEDNEPGAQTERPGAVGPVRWVLGGATSPAALFHRLSWPRSRRDSGLLALLAVHFVPEHAHRLVVDELQLLERSHEFLAVGSVIEPQLLQRHALDRTQIGDRGAEKADSLQSHRPERLQAGDTRAVHDQYPEGLQRRHRVQVPQRRSGHVQVFQRHALERSQAA